MSACFPSGQFYKMVFLIGINGGGRTLVSVTAHFSFILQGGEIPEKRASFLLCTFLRDLLKAFSYYNLYSCVLSRFYLFFPMSFILQIPSRVLPRHTLSSQQRHLSGKRFKNVPTSLECVVPFAQPSSPVPSGLPEALSFLSRGAFTGRAGPRWARVRASMNHLWRREIGHIRKHPHPELSPVGR